MNRLLLILIAITMTFSQFTAVKTDQQPTIDGLIDDAWDNALKFEDFRQRWPNLHAKPTVESTVYLMYDETNIYIAGKYYQKQSTVKGTRYRRDVTDLWNDDWFQFNVDPFNKGVSGFYLGLNPANALIDGKVGPYGQEDESWDGIIITKTQIHPDYWSFEIQIPMNTLDFQNEEIQTWGMTFGRNYSANQEQIWTHEIPKDNHLLMTSYLKIHDFKYLHKGEPFKGTPYMYYENQQDGLANDNLSDKKIGFDFLYQPNSATNIIATVNPDFAQLESDADVINVSDAPTQYPEKRPFFTNNSEFYNAAPGFRSRNIGKINAGLKLVQQFGALKYDMSYVNDKENNHWYFANFIYDNSKNFKIEYIGAMKDQAQLLNTDKTIQNPERAMANNVLALNYWMYDKRLSFFSYLEMNNVVENHYGTRSGVNYRVREYYLGYTLDIKEAQYNSSEIGYFLFSNNVDQSFNSNYSFFFDDNDATIRQLRFGLNIDHRALHSDPSANYTQLRSWASSQLFINRDLGNWWLNINYSPDTGQKFRDYNGNSHADNIGRFNLVKQNSGSYNFNINTDGSKMISANVYFSSSAIRQADSKQYGFNLSFKPLSELRVSYNLNHIDIDQSAYQNKLIQDVHRFKAEYSVTDKLNIRTVFSLNAFDLPNAQTDETFTNNNGNPENRTLTGYNQETPVFNLTGSWEYEPGSFAFLVFNNYRSQEKAGSNKFKDSTKFNSIIFKVNKSFQF